MQENFLPFSKPSISREAINEVVACLESGWITTGPRVKKFEELLSGYLGCANVQALTSATAGLHLVLLAMELEPGDEVITTPLTFVATLNTIVLAGAKPVLVDVDETYNIDPLKIAAVITPRTRAIVPVHFTGLPVDLDPLYQLAEKHNLRIIEDCAQAIGSHYKGRMLGSFGDTQVFSFHPNKNMTTGEGGCVSSRDPSLAEKISQLRFHGIDRSAWDRFSKQGNQHYDVAAAGYKYNMMDIQAALGIHQLLDLEVFIQRRTELALRYYELLGDFPQWTLPQLPGYDFRHSWHLFAPILNVDAAGIDRDSFIQAMKQENIGLGLHYTPAHLFSFYQQKFGFKPGDFPICEEICSGIVSLPLFPGMTHNDQDRVIAAMQRVFNSSQRHNP